MAFKENKPYIPSVCASVCLYDKINNHHTHVFFIDLPANS